VAAAATLILGSGCQAVAFLLIPDQDDSTGWLTWIADNVTRGQLSKLFDVLAMPFLVCSAAVYIMLGRRRSPRLAWIGGVSLACGLVGLSMLQGWEVLAYNMVTDELVSPEVVAAAVDDITSSPAGIAVLVLFMVFAFGGLMVTIVSLWRSQVVPRAAVLLLLAGFVVDAFLAPVEGHVVMFLAASWIAITVLRARSPHHLAEPSVSIH
jgi:hypothetical protein